MFENFDKNNQNFGKNSRYLLFTIQFGKPKYFIFTWRIIIARLAR